LSLGSILPIYIDWPVNTVRLQHRVKLRGVENLKKFTAYYGIRKFITALTREIYSNPVD